MKKKKVETVKQMQKRIQAIANKNFDAAIKEAYLTGYKKGVAKKK